MGNFEYTFDNDCGNYLMSLDKIYNTEGYCDLLFVNGGPNYQYYRKDHLGNNREVWNANGNVTYQRTQYYPSGLPWADSQGSWVQNKKYNGKEFVEAHGLDEYDSEARWFYPAIMRTTTPDPLAEKYYSISPYAWCGNNPVNAVDPDGMDYIITINRDKDGNITGITFSATVYITGDGANQKRADELDALAKKTYTTKEINGVSVGFNVNYEYSDKVKGIGDVGEQKGTNVLYFESGDGRSSMNPLDYGEGFTGSYGTISNVNNREESNLDVIHETAHFLGFIDRYNDKEVNGRTVSIPNKGYSKDLMGSRNFNFQKSHYSDMYNYVVNPERTQKESLIKFVYFPSLAIKVLNRTNSIIGNKFIDKK